MTPGEWEIMPAKTRKVNIDSWITRRPAPVESGQ